jgi:hypothetical protein
MTTRQLVAAIAAFLLAGAVITHLVYGSIWATPIFH